MLLKVTTTVKWIEKNKQDEELLHRIAQQVDREVIESWRTNGESLRSLRHLVNDINVWKVL